MDAEWINVLFILVVLFGVFSVAFAIAMIIMFIKLCLNIGEIRSLLENLDDRDKLKYDIEHLNTLFLAGKISQEEYDERRAPYDKLFF